MTPTPELRQSNSSNDLPPVPLQEVDQVTTLSTEEEASLAEASDKLKVRANALFVQADYSEAIATYQQALTTCPPSREFEATVLKSNLAACYLKLAKWKEAKKAATAALDGLERLQNNDSQEPETPAPDGAGLNSKGTREADQTRIRIKSLLRRAQASCELGGWAALQGAMDDYQALSKMPTMLPRDRALVQRQLALLPSRTQAAQQAEMGQLMGQLKQLGNGLLKPFGLSTDNFQMQKDDQSGGYSMNFRPSAS